MKKTLLGTVVALAVSSVAVPASASVGTITINGNLTQSTCTVNIGDSSDAVITLPTLPTSALTHSGDTAGTTGFVMDLTNCSTGTGSVRAYFENGATVDAATGRLNNAAATNGAANVQVELLDEKMNSLFVGNTSQRNNSAKTVQNGAAKLVYQARYYATGESKPGDVATSVTYSIDYE